MSFSLKLPHKALILASGPLIVNFIFVGALAMLFQQSDAEVHRQMRSKTLISQATGLSKLIYDASQLLNGYRATNHSLWRDRLDDIMHDAPKRLDELKNLAGDNELQQGIIVKLRTDTAEGCKKIEEAKSVIEGTQDDLAQLRTNDLLKEIRMSADTLHDDAEELIADARKVVDAGPQEEAQNRQKLQSLIGLGLFLNFVGALAVAWFFSKAITKPLSIVSDNAHRLARRDQLNPALPGDDELAHLDRVFHQMAVALDEAARRERAIVENAIDVICSIDANGKFTEVSASCLSAWGYEPNELLGQRYISLVAPDSTNKTLEAMRESAGKKSFSYENTLKRKDGSQVEVLWSGCCSVADQTLFCVAHDMTERKKLEQLKRDFVAMISHDLRTPLTSVQCFLEMLSEGFYDDSPEKAKAKAKVSDSDISRLINLVSSLLDIEKMESGKMETHPTHFPVANVLERSIGSVRSLAESKNVQLNLVPSDAELFADEDQLVQVIVNLLSNAIKFSNKEGLVTLSAIENLEAIEFRVADTGKGIPAEHKDKIFDRFEQVELADSRLRGGTGLGLAICKAIVSAHKGQIGVESEEGKGSTFWFRIPKESSQSSDFSVKLKAPADKLNNQIA